MKQRQLLRLSATFLLIAMLLWIAPHSGAQQITGSVSVRVTDNTGAVLSGAAVSLNRTATGEKKAGTSGSDGSYTFDLIQPGEYSVTVEHDGFAPTTLQNLTVSIGEHINVPVQLAVGSTTQSVTVSAESASLLNAESASVGQAIQSHVIQDLPLNGRNFVQLLYLATGAQPVAGGDSPASQWTGRSDVSVSLGGLRESDVSYLVNGIETRNPRFGNAGLFLSPDAIQEFRVQRTTFGAEFGESASVVNMTIRSGSNQFHGDAFGLNRNRDYAANDYFLKQAGQPRPPFNQNNFGVTVAGPAWIPKLYNGRNRTFFMFNYEGFRQVQGTVLTGLYPSAAQLKGNLADDSAGTGIYPKNSIFCAQNAGSPKCADVINPSTGQPFPGNVIPTGMLDPVDQKALPYIPAPNFARNQGSPSFPSFNTIASPDIRNTWDQYNGRIDQTFSSRDSLYATFSDETQNLYNPSIQPLGGNNYPLADHLWTVSYTHVFSPALLNELRLGLNNSITYLTPESANGPNYAQSVFGLKNTDSDPLVFGVPDFGISGTSGIGSFSETIGAQAKYYQLTDNVSLIRGHHNLMAGVELMHMRINQTTDFSGNPNFTFDGRYTGTVANGTGLGDFLLGTPYSASGAAGNSAQDLHTNYYGAYVKDNWQVTPSFLVSYGLRYEFSRPPVESHNRQAYFDLGSGQEVLAGQGIRRSIVKPDYLGFAPRVGFTWQPPMFRNTVLRGGFGIYYATDNLNELQFSIVGSPFYQVQTIDSDPTRPTLSMENMLPAFATSANLNPFTLDPNSRLPYYEQYGLDLQQVIGKDFLFELEYAGSIGKDLPQRYNANVATIDPTGTLPISSRVPFPNFGFILRNWNEGSSSYNALTAKLEKRYSNGLSFLGSFTWSKALDQGITDDFSAISRDFRTYDWGVSDYDVPVRFVGNATYDLPFGKGRPLLANAGHGINYLVGGWQVNAIVTFSAGQYGTATLNTDWLNIGSFSQSRPNIDKSKATVGRKVPTQYFNAAAFTIPTTHIEGNAGRNSLEQPGYDNWDTSLFKTLPIHESINFQMRFEFFNTFNHTQFGNANLSLGPGFGQIASDRGPRVIQLGGRLNW
jgi:hypothetical protein